MRLLITVQAVAAPSELCGHIPLVAHVLETHGAPFKIQILLFVSHTTIGQTFHLPDFILDQTPKAQHYFECLRRNLRSW